MTTDKQERILLAIALVAIIGGVLFTVTVAVILLKYASWLWSVL